MEYNGRVTDDEKIALIGKGLCFDSGGYNLKPGNAMKGMHGDMGGAAAVIAAMGAIAEAKLGINVTAVIPACENMISGKARNRAISLSLGMANTSKLLTLMLKAVWHLLMPLLTQSVNVELQH